jgi:hypothetical protein
MPDDDGTQLSLDEVLYIETNSDAIESDSSGPDYVSQEDSPSNDSQES